MSLASYCTKTPDMVHLPGAGCLCHVFVPGSPDVVRLQVACCYFKDFAPGPPTVHVLGATVSSKFLHLDP